MEHCFVIQPFDKDKFDKRFVDIFSPAITLAGLTPYRVDDDASVRIPINQIEDGIKKFSLCFAEITTDNPNVWYELGFAFASDKDVVMVCSEERQNKFPFDIQHRSIITYKTSSISDYDTLKHSITEKIKAYLIKRVKVETLIENPVRSSEGLKPHEVTMLMIILENQLTEDDSVSAFSLQSDMGKAGFTKAASNLAIRELVRKDLIKTFKAFNNFNDEYPACQLSSKGELWLLENQDKIEFTKPEKIVNQNTIRLDVESNELPF